MAVRRRFKRRHRYNLLSMLVLLGLIIAAIVFTLVGGGFGERSSDLLLNLAASLIGAVASFGIFNPILRSIEEGGIRMRGALRKEEIVRNIRNAGQRVRIMETWTDILVDSGRIEDKTNAKLFRQAVLSAIESGAHLQILLLDPNSEAAEQRQKDLKEVNVRKCIMDNLRQLHQFIEQEQRLDSHIEVKVYRSSLSLQIYQWDDLAIVTSYQNRISTQSDQLELPMDTAFGDFVNEIFESRWREAQHFKDSYYSRLDVTIVEQNQQQSFSNIKFIEYGDHTFINDNDIYMYVTQRSINFKVRLGREPAERVLAVAEPKESIAVGMLFQYKYGGRDEGIYKII